MFYACFTLIGSWEGRKNFKVGISLNKKLVRVGLQETNNFFFRPKPEVCKCVSQMGDHELLGVQLLILGNHPLLCFSYLKIVIIFKCPGT